MIDIVPLLASSAYQLLNMGSLMSWTSSRPLFDSRKVQRAAGVGVALAVVLSGILTGHAFAAAPTFSCPASYDAETASAATLQACGDTSYPLSSITPTAGGGQSYNYEADGIGVSYTVPPSSFDPANASAAELKEYGVPAAPPADSPEYPLWNKMIHNMHFNGTPPSHLVFLHNTTGGRSANASAESTEGGAQTSHNWSGYGDYASTQAYSKASTYFIEPSPVATCTNAEEVNWAGLGGWNSENLAQNGTANGIPGLVAHKAWWEILPAEMSPVGEHATAGYYFEAQTLYEGYWESRSHFDFYFYNYADGSWVSPHIWTTNGVDRSTSEFIVERPTEEHSNHLHYIKPLMDYSNITMQGFTEGNPLADYPYNYTTMTRRESPYTTLATVEGIPTGTYLFSDIFHNCGAEEWAGF